MRVQNSQMRKVCISRFETKVFVGVVELWGSSSKPQKGYFPYEEGLEANLFFKMSTEKNLCKAKYGQMVRHFPDFTKV